MLHGLRVDSRPRLFLLFGCPCSGSCVGAVEEGQTTREGSQRETTPELRAWTIFERPRKFEENVFIREMRLEESMTFPQLGMA